MVFLFCFTLSSTFNLFQFLVFYINEKGEIRQQKYHSRSIFIPWKGSEDCSMHGMQESCNLITIREEEFPTFTTVIVTV